MTRICLETLDGFPLVEPGDDLVELICRSLEAGGQVLEDGCVLVLAQKIVSKAEGRYRNLSEIVPGDRAKLLATETAKDPRLVQAILDESTEVVRRRKGVLIVRHKRGWVMAQAGIDQSNIEGGDEGRILLLPEDPDASALKLKTELERRSGVSLGVVIADSFGRPFRNGTTGIAIGAAGLTSFLDKRGHRDLFGKTLQVSTIAHADEIASAASILMGQADEGTPVVLIRGLSPSAHVDASSLVRPIEDDMFR
ncbi:coenzyme F420-0:L-glutamate ligase [Roseibium aggregatum]|uniref:Coenzyme F420-0:L-glutamate ligase n=1 Tax=Roseibium aggregatum TaxID=187304 RepID=A0A939EDY1_9HYPH|nr:coenzyme F420-0:L-glutamate ligase [Roseibium aggregatum]MBN9670986.1 coenzyme F420-0:L-glutamate ligase [Roseibium aggregatum]